MKTTKIRRPHPGRPDSWKKSVNCRHALQGRNYENRRRTVLRKTLAHKNVSSGILSASFPSRTLFVHESCHFPTKSTPETSFPPCARSAQRNTKRNLSPKKYRIKSRFRARSAKKKWNCTFVAKMKFPCAERAAKIFGMT